MTTCKTCGAAIVWIKTSAGKSMPCDAKQLIYWENPKGASLIVTPNGKTLKADLEGDSAKATGIGYISHFATCPNANTHRRR